MRSLINFPRTNSFLPSYSSFFDDLFSQDFFSKVDLGTTVPAVNISEGIKHYSIELAVPGHKKEDFNLELHADNSMTISAQKEENTEEKEEQLTHKEFSFSSFSRRFTLPQDADKSRIQAGYENGLLKVSIPKFDTTEKPSEKKTIPVN